MLVTKKINFLSFIFGKPQAASNLKASGVSKAQNLKNTNIDDLDKRISITKSKDFYKAHSVSVINCFSQLNR